MSGNPQIAAPGGFVPQVGIAFGTAGTDALAVDLSSPFPTRAVSVAARSTPLAGTTGGGTVGPFVPELGRPIWVTLSGTWSGTAQLMRSTDGGTTLRAITGGDGTVKARWAGAVNAPVAEETVAEASYWLVATLASGTLGYEVRQ